MSQVVLSFFITFVRGPPDGYARACYVAGAKLPENIPNTYIHFIHLPLIARMSKIPYLCR